MVTTHTNETVLATAGIDPTNLEFPDLEIPVLTGIQRQGDVIVVPSVAPVAGVPIGDGVDVVEAETDSMNSHILIGDGHWLRHSGDGLVAGTVWVPEGGEAFLIHTEEHNALGIGPGCYQVRRQREWAPEVARSHEEVRADAERERIARQEAYRRVRD